MECKKMTDKIEEQNENSYQILILQWLLSLVNIIKLNEWLIRFNSLAPGRY